MKKLLLSISLLFMGAFAFAQSNKMVVCVENFSGYGSEGSLSSLKNGVVTTASQTGRIKVVDVNDHTEGMTYNAFLRGTVDDVKFKPTEFLGSDGKRHRGLSSNATFTLTIVDAGNGEVIRQETLYSTGTGRNEDEALADAMKVAGGSSIKNFIMNAFPLGGYVVALEEFDAKKAKTVYIDLGSNDGISKGQKLEVFKEVDIAGEKSRKLIGELKVEEVMGGSRSLCKVTKNAEAILNEINNGSTLPIETKFQKTGFFGL